jgi:hypothetical protein
VRWLIWVVHVRAVVVCCIGQGSSRLLNGQNSRDSCAAFVGHLSIHARSGTNYVQGLSVLACGYLK